jgi:hypothetical protein
MRLLSGTRAARPVNHYRITRVVIPAATLDLVTLDQAKAMLGIAPADTTQDAQIAQHIAASSLAINHMCNRIFAVQTYRDQVRGAYGCWGEPFVTRQYPIVVDSETGLPLVAVTEDGAVLDPALMETDPPNGRLYRLDGAAAPAAWGSAAMLVDYTAGFSEIPADVQGACLEWVGIRYGAVGRDPALRSETVPDLLTQVFNSGDSGMASSSSSTAVPPTVRQWLSAYRMWFV